MLQYCVHVEMGLVVDVHVISFTSKGTQPNYLFCACGSTKIFYIKIYNCARENVLCASLDAEKIRQNILHLFTKRNFKNWSEYQRKNKKRC
jgi:hypothetical protein